MKILMVTPWYPDRLSANSGIFIQAQARAFSEQHEVLVVSSKIDYDRFARSSYDAEISQSNNLTEHKVVVQRSFPFFNQLNHLWISFRYAYRHARLFRPEIIYASVGYPGAIWGWGMSKLLKAPFVFMEHTRPKNNFRSWFHAVLTKFGLRRAQLVLAVSHSLAHELQLLVNTRVFVQPNLVDTGPFSDIAISGERVPQIGFLGGMNTNVKGLDILLEAVAGITENFILHIGGAGKLEANYRAQAKALGIGSKCIFNGFIPYQQIPAFMSRVHFLVCSSRYETFCVALAEAMAAGRPVVSTRCGGPEDFVNSTNGLLVENGNVLALREGIREMLLKRTMYEPDIIRKQVEERFSKQVFLIRMNGIFQSVCKDYKSGNRKHVT